MDRYRWTLRVAIGSVAFLAVIAVFVAVVRVFNVMIAGVYREGVGVDGHDDGSFHHRDCVRGDDCHCVGRDFPAAAGRVRLSHLGPG